MANTYKKPRYKGHLPCRNGKHWWRIEIYFKEDQEKASVTPKELTFPAEEPLVIDWEEMRPEDVFQGASATLRVESMTDREFINFYAYKAGEIWLKVFKVQDPRLAIDGVLYWQGSLDPELYEEPYERADGYTVSLTFSDFGYLDRLKYNMKGLKDLQTVLLQALELAGFPPSADLVVEKISMDIPETDDADVKRMTLADLSCASENWFDEEGEASTLREVIEQLFLPLSLHITQRNGKIYIFDFNEISESSPIAVRWTSDSQTLSTDETFNNVKLTFSPYCDSSDSLVTFEYKGRESIDVVSFSRYFPATGSKEEYDRYGLILSWQRDWEVYGKYDNGEWVRDWSYIAFNLCFDQPDKAKGLAIHQNYIDKYNKTGQKDGVYDGPEYPPSGAFSSDETDLWPKAFKLLPILDGEETEGVAVQVTAGCGSLRDAWVGGGEEGRAPVHRHGAPCDTPWGLANTIVIGTSWCSSVSYKGYRYDPFDYFCERTYKDLNLLPSPVNASEQKVLTTEPIYLPPIDVPKQKIVDSSGWIRNIDASNRVPFLVRVEVPMLLDCRYNFQTDNGYDANDKDAHDRNDERNQTVFKRNSRWVFVPFTAVIRDKDGHITHVYTNRKVMQRAAPGLLSYAMGEWIPAGHLMRYRLDDHIQKPNEFMALSNTLAKTPVTEKVYEGEEADNVDAYFGQAWLAYYASDPFEENACGVGGWQSNRHNIGRADLYELDLKAMDYFGNTDNATTYIKMLGGVKIFPSFKSLKNGEYLPYPPDGGYLEITVYRGLLGSSAGKVDDSSNDFTFRLDMSLRGAWASAYVEDVKGGCKPEDLAALTKKGDRQGIYNMIRWHMFKAPEIEVVKNDMSFDSAEVEDYELTAYLDRNAHEELSLDTSYGTIPEQCPMARGLMVLTSSGKPVKQLTRRGVTDTPERLLFGTLYSQYSQRRTTLSGEAGLITSERIPPYVYSDENQDEWWEVNGTEASSPIFYEFSRTDDLIEGTTELTLTQFRRDDYEASDIQEVVAEDELEQ